MKERSFTGARGTWSTWTLEHSFGLWQTMRMTISFVIKPYVRRDVVCASWWGKEKEIMGKRAAHAFMLSAALVCERG